MMNFNLITPVRSKLIRESACGQPCTFQIAGVCNYNWLTTVLAHLETPKHGGVNTKASDINAAYACSACHDLIDMRDPRCAGHQDHFEYYKRRAINRTLHLLLHQEVLVIPDNANK